MTVSSDVVRLRQARDLMGRDYAQPLDVATIAATVHMYAGYFSRPVSRRVQRVAIQPRYDAPHRARQDTAAPRRHDGHRCLRRRGMHVAGLVQLAIHRTCRRDAERVPVTTARGIGRDPDMRAAPVDQTGQERRSETGARSVASKAWMSSSLTPSSRWMTTTRPSRSIATCSGFASPTMCPSRTCAG